MNIGKLKEIIKKYENAGATNETPVWIAGDIKLEGNLSDLKEMFQVTSIGLNIREDWTPNMACMIIFFNAKYNIPDPEDGFPYV